MAGRSLYLSNRTVERPKLKKNKKKALILKKLPAHQQYLFDCIGRAMQLSNKRHTMTHADHLKVLDEYSSAITEDWIKTQPDGAIISKLLGKA